MNSGIETVLETERLRLTTWLPEQVNDLSALHSDPEVAQYIEKTGPVWTMEQSIACLERWQENFAQHRMGKLRLIRKSDDCFVGRAGFGLYPDTQEPEIGFALFKKHWGKGYASEAAAGLRDWLFEETGHEYFIGLADLRNSASLRVLDGIGMIKTHIGFEPSGLKCQFHVLKKDQWHRLKQKETQVG